MLKQPNIIIILADSWRGDAMGHLGNSAAVTPHLDRLVADKGGISFSNAYCQNPVCGPSRCCMMTGWYPHTKGHRTQHQLLNPEHGDPNLLSIVQDNGYDVCMCGKNDFVPSISNLNLAITNDLCDYDLDPHWHGPVLRDARGDKDNSSYYSFYIGEMKKTKEDGYYHDTDWADVQKSLDFIENRDSDNPFCLYLPLIYPHPPYGVAEPFFSMTDRKKLPERIHFEDCTGKAPALGQIKNNLNMDDWTEEQWTELRATYYGMCSYIDHLCGMLFDKLEEQNLFDDTFIVFTSDHGDYTGDYGLVEKCMNSFEDALVKVPFIIKPTKDMAGKSGISNSMIELSDVSETIYDLLNINPGYTRFGKSVLPIINDLNHPHRDYVFCEGGRLQEELHCSEYQSLEGMPDKEAFVYWPRLSTQQVDEPFTHEKAIMCRSENFKYVYRHKVDDEFYDLTNDPNETQNEINNEEYKTIIAEHKTTCFEWMVETSDVISHDFGKREFRKRPNVVT